VLAQIYKASIVTQGHNI